MLVTVGTVKGQGATTLAVALAARSPTAGALVVEADPTGGDLAFRFGHHREPGLSELAADTRTGAGVERDLAAYAQRLPMGVDVVFAPADQQVDDGRRRLREEPGQSVQAVRLVADNCVRLLRAAAAGRMVVVDVGRLGWESPALPLAAAADVLLLVTRAQVDGIDAVQVRRERILSLPGMRASVRLVLAGRPPCPADEIARVVGLPVAAVLPEDRRGAAVLTGQARPGWGWTRLELPRAARALALSLQAEPATPTIPELRSPTAVSRGTTVQPVARESRS
jgi:hypothetical protein